MIWLPSRWHRLGVARHGPPYPLIIAAPPRSRVADESPVPLSAPIGAGPYARDHLGGRGCLLHHRLNSRNVGGREASLAPHQEVRPLLRFLEAVSGGATDTEQVGHLLNLQILRGDTVAMSLCHGSEFNRLVARTSAPGHRHELVVGLQILVRAADAFLVYPAHHRLETLRVELHHAATLHRGYDN